MKTLGKKFLKCEDMLLETKAKIIRTTRRSFIPIRNDLMAHKTRKRKRSLGGTFDTHRFISARAEMVSMQPKKWIVNQSNSHCKKFAILKGVTRLSSILVLLYSILYPPPVKLLHLTSNPVPHTKKNKARTGPL